MTRTARGRRSTDGVAKRARSDQRPAEKAAPTAKPSSSSRDLSPSKERVTSAWRSFLHDRSVRSRVAALVLLPLLCTVVLGALFFKNALDDASTASKVERLTTIGQTAADLIHAIQDERDISGVYEPLPDTPIAEVEAVVDARANTDAALADLNSQLDEIRDDNLPASVEAAIAAFDREANRLDRHRDQRNTEIPTFEASGAGAYHDFADAVRGVMTAARTVADDPATARLIRALDDIAQANESASMERGLIAFFTSPDPATAAEVPLISTQGDAVSVLDGQQDLLVGRFLGGFEDPNQAQQYADRITVGNREVQVVRANIRLEAPVGVAQDVWFTSATNRLTELRDIENETNAEVLALASEATDSARWRALISALAVLAVLAVTVALTYVVARSIVGPLRRLRAAALDAAKHELPALVDRIHRDGPAAARNVTDAVQPEGRDEIGQVATAFNNVHSTAVSVAGQQALLRQNLDTIVVNLSRRTQSLVDRQLGEIEGLEARERDPDQLSTLFRIDHLATRVRRHAESLLVLAGVDEMRKHGTASPVLDVVRTAVGEVEQYPRVRFGVMPTDLVASIAVDDVAHLLAELIDNATEFSAPSTPVNVTSQPLLGGGLRLQVTDSGLGIPADQLDQLNSRLTNPGDIDVAASRTLGLYVVARLASKHGIKVRLEGGATGGTVAQVDLPSQLILSPLDTTEGVIPPVPAEPDHPQPRQQAFVPEEGLSPYLPSAPSREPAAPGAMPGSAPGLPRRGGEGDDSPRRPAPAQPTPTAPPMPVASPTPAEGEPRPPLPSRSGEPAPTRFAEPAQTRPAPAQPTTGDIPRTVEPLQPAGSAASAPSTPATPSAPSAPSASDQDADSGQPWEDTPTPEPAWSGAAGQHRASRHAASGAARPASSLRGPEPDLPDGDSPIYESVRSAWFSKGSGPRDWSNPADEGWRRAAEALRSAEEAASARRIQRESQAGVDTRPVPRADERPAARAPERPAARPPERPAAHKPERPAPRGGQRPVPGERRPTPEISRPAASAPVEPPRETTRETTREQRRPVEAPAAQAGPDVSPSGLPMRRRGASLVPGSIAEVSGAAGAAARDAAGQPPKDAGSVASTLSSLQRGVSRGREETGGWVPKRPGDPERSNP